MLTRALTAAALIASLAVDRVEAIPKITVNGAKFFKDTGDQFYIKGVAYQRTEEDPLIDSNQCMMDASLMENLGANAIRVYHVDPRGDHTDCMKIFADKGIYLFVDLDTTTTQISPESPAWSQRQVDAFTAVLDEFSKFDNTAGVFVGNEVITMSNGSFAAPYVKAAVRDVKKYRDSKGMRKIPVGYSAADIAELRPILQNYLACGSNGGESLDFFSLNAYEWCGPSSYTGSGYADLVKNASGYPVPIFFSETGCNTNRPRTFDDQAAIFSSKMNDIWSGAIVYEWIEEKNNYGLVNYGPKVDQTTATAALDGYPRSGTPTPVSPDFSNLKGQWATLTPAGIKSSDYKPSNSAPACPTSMVNVWNVDGNVALPTIGQSAGKFSSAPTGTATGSVASPSTTKKSSASGPMEVAGMSAGLLSVILGFIWWL